MMTSAQLKQARSSLGLTRAQMAVVLDLPGAAALADKEEGRVPVIYQDEVRIIAYLHGHRPAGLSPVDAANAARAPGGLAKR